MSQIEVPKLSAYIAIGAVPDSICVAKLSFYAVLVPGDDGGAEVPDRQGFCYAQRIGRG